MSTQNATIPAVVASANANTDILEMAFTVKVNHYNDDNGSQISHTRPRPSY